jgi:hypothetical protein
VKEQTHSAGLADQDRAHARHLKTVLLTFLALTLFDAVLGGAMSALLRIEGWLPLDQRINDVYQLIYGTMVASTLGWLYLRLKSIKPIVAISILFIGYVEDTVFYLLIPLVNPIINFITKGVRFELATGTLFPERISGWIGWVGRMLFGQNISFEFTDALAFNAMAIVAVFLLWAKGRLMMNHQAQK